MSKPADRVVKSEPYPELEEFHWLDEKEKPDWLAIANHLKEEGPVTQTTIQRILKEMKETLEEEKNVIHIEDPCVIVGSLHGSFNDLYEIVTSDQPPPLTKYCFLGNYINRGTRSVETLILLFCLKLTCPKEVVLLRGQQETRQMSEHFKTECEAKYGPEEYEFFCEIFTYLPLACTISEKILCVSGGIGPDFDSLESLASLDRVKEVPLTGLLTDILWSDPVEMDAVEEVKTFKSNDKRGCGYLYGPGAVESFLNRNKFFSIIRTHDPLQMGYKFYNYGKKNTLPSVIDIFSCSNHCGIYNNQGAYIKFSGDDFEMKQLRVKPEAIILPKRKDGIDWTMPLLAQTVVQMNAVLMKRYSDLIKSTIEDWNEESESANQSIEKESVEKEEGEGEEEEESPKEDA